MKIKNKNLAKQFNKVQVSQKMSNDNLLNQTKWCVTFLMIYVLAIWN